MTTHAKTPPWYVGAEQSVIGGLLLDNAAVWRVAGLTAAHFYEAKHAAIWAANVGLVAAKRPADVVTVFERLQAQGQAEAWGGLAYLNALAQSVPSAANAKRYTDIVIDRVLRRDVLDAAGRTKALAQDTEGDAVEVLDKTAMLFGGLRQHGQRSEPQSLADLLVARADHWQTLEAGETTSGIPTPANP